MAAELALPTEYPDFPTGQQPVDFLSCGHPLLLHSHPHDAPSIGLLLCKTQNRVIAEYAVRGVDKPLGIAALPDEPERELEGLGGNG